MGIASRAVGIRLVRRPVACCAVLAAAVLVTQSCGDSSSKTTTFVPQYITMRRAWLPGERDSLVARLKRTHQLTIPGVGDLSDYADSLLPTDSAIETIPNPAYTGASGSRLGPTGIAGAPGAVMIPGTGWTTLVIQIQTINKAQTPNDTINRTGVLWYNNTDSTWVGFLFAATISTSLSNQTLNTTSYDNSGAKSGAGGGEVQTSTSPSTIWLANGGQTPNTMSISSINYFGSGSTVTSGPYTGGTERIGFTGSVSLNNIRLTRTQGTGTPTTQTISFSSNFLWAADFVCVFPTPCTSAAGSPLRPTQ